MNSHTNNVLNMVRDTARILNKPQSVVTANWQRNGLLSKGYSAASHTGITRSDYKKALLILNRLATLAN